jgi:HEAT repeat protein
MRKQYEADIARLQERLTRALTARTWPEGLDAAHDLFLYAARVPSVERRSFMLSTRRFLSPHVFAAFIDLGLRHRSQQGPVADVLRWSGLEGADAIVEAIRGHRNVGPRRFLHQALAAMPDSWSAVAPLLGSSDAHEVSHAAVILGQMGRPEALDPLKAQLTHSDPQTRRAVLAALSNFNPNDVAEALGLALGHSSADTRAAAAEAIGRVAAASLAMPLVAALGAERDSRAWRAMIRALGHLASNESCAALASIALARRRLFGRSGYSMGRRLEAVRALSTVPAPCREPALARLAREGDPPVQRAAQDALTRGGGPVS